MFKDFTKYEIYEDGRIWSYKTKRFLKPATMKNGYQRVWLSDNEGNIKMYLLHRVVWESVTGEPIPSNMEINHISENKTENFFANLQLVSHKENINFGSRTEKARKSISKALKGIIPKANPPKQVGAFKDGKLVMTFPSTMEAGRNGFCQNIVAACCRGERKTHKGYEWRYI